MLLLIYLVALKVTASWCVEHVCSLTIEAIITHFAIDLVCAVSSVSSHESANCRQSVWWACLDDVGAVVSASSESLDSNVTLGLAGLFGFYEKIRLIMLCCCHPYLIQLLEGAQTTTNNR